MEHITKDKAPVSPIVSTEELRSRASNLQTGKTLARGVRMLLGVIIIVAATVCILAVIDMRNPNYVPTMLEQTAMTNRLIIGAVIAVIGGILFAFCERINSTIDRELERISRIRANRRVKERIRQTRVDLPVITAEPSETDAK